MAQAPQLPSITIPSAIYSTPVQQELKNTKLEGEGVKFVFLIENWPDGKCFDLIGELSTANGQPVYKPWISAEFHGGPFTPGPGGSIPTTREYTAMWNIEPDGSGGHKQVKGDILMRLIPAQTFRTTITVSII